MKAVAILLIICAVFSISQITVVWSPADSVVTGWASTLEQNEAGMYTISEDQLSSVKRLAELTKYLKSAHDKTFWVTSIALLMFGVTLLIVNRRQKKRYNNKLQNIQVE